jgi:hypothetical protein
MSTRHPDSRFPMGMIPDAWDPPRDHFTHAACGGSILFRLDEHGRSYTHARCDTCGAHWDYSGEGWKEQER